MSFVHREGQDRSTRECLDDTLVVDNDAAQAVHAAVLKYHAWVASNFFPGLRLIKGSLDCQEVSTHITEVEP